jgi:hypothetical protein
MSRVLLLSKNSLLFLREIGGFFGCYDSGEQVSYGYGFGGVDAITVEVLDTLGVIL